MSKKIIFMAPIMALAAFGVDEGHYYKTTYMIQYPAFEKITHAKEANYEIRRYPSIPVILTLEKAKDHAEALQLGYDEFKLCLNGQNTRLKNIDHFDFITAQKYILPGADILSYEVFIPLKKDDPFVGKPWNPYLEIQYDVPGFRAAKKFRGKLTEEKIKEESEKLNEDLKSDNLKIKNSIFRVTKYHESSLPIFCVNEIEYEIEKPSFYSTTRQ